jgi:hypothetical protein
MSVLTSYSSGYGLVVIFGNKGTPSEIGVTVVERWDVGHDERDRDPRENLRDMWKALIDFICCGWSLGAKAYLFIPCPLATLCCHYPAQFLSRFICSSVLSAFFCNNLISQDLDKERECRWHSLILHAGLD